MEGVNWREDDWESDLAGYAVVGVDFVHCETW